MNAATSYERGYEAMNAPSGLFVCSFVAYMLASTPGDPKQQPISHVNMSR